MGIFFGMELRDRSPRMAQMKKVIGYKWKWRSHTFSGVGAAFPEAFQEEVETLLSCLWQQKKKRLTKLSHALNGNLLKVYRGT